MHEEQTNDKTTNPNIPHFIANTPWYTKDQNSTTTTSKSQSLLKNDIWYDREPTTTAAPAAKKFRKGACTNCGSMSHKAKDCLERPRKVGAKYNNTNIRSDETVQEISTTWESKRDRWSGFKADDYAKIVDAVKKPETSKDVSTKDTVDEESWYEKEIKWETHKSVINPNAWKSSRDRHDRAHYLQDLSKDLGYDEATKTFQGEEGDLNERGFFEKKLQGHGLEHRTLRDLAAVAAKKGLDVHLEANPTASYVKLREQLQPKSISEVPANGSPASASASTSKQEESATKVNVPKSLLAKYGGAAHSVRSGETSHTSSSLSDPEVPVEKPYGNHTRQWGTYVVGGRPAYACCHSDVKHSVCLGEKGIAINDKKNGKRSGTDDDTEQDMQDSASKKRFRVAD